MERNRTVGNQFAFSFKVTGLDRETFSVVSFKGYECLSKPYRFEIVLASTESGLDFTSILHKPCKLEIFGRGEPRVFHGVAYLFRHVRRAGYMYVYQVLMMPRFQQLSIGSNSRVFLKKNCIEIIQSLLKQEHVAVDNRIQGDETFARREYICQFNESDFNFISRWLEAHGVHYFFEQTENAEKIVLSNTNLAHTPCRNNDSPMTYGPPSGLDHVHREDVVHTFVSEHCCLPGSVSFKDYNYELGMPQVTASQEISGGGQQVLYQYGENFLGQGYGSDPAKILSEQLKSSESLFQGKSYCPELRSGGTFELKGHYNADYDAKYLLYHVVHEGKDGRYLRQGTGGGEQGESQMYSNSFRALLPDRNFRPRCKTPVPRYFGLLSAVIDAEGEGKYAELDEKGRYKVRLPFDSADKPNGKASHWIRLAEPYAGNSAQDQTYGMHFPLVKGTEVLISYVEGDIDRPIILSAVYNENNENPVKRANQARHVIKTKGGNRIIMDDTENKESISLVSCDGKSMLHISSDGVTSTTEEKVVEASWNDKIEAKCGSSMEFTAGSSLEAFGGTKAGITIGFQSELTVGTTLEAALGGKIEIGEMTSLISSEADTAADENISFKGGMNTVVSSFYKKIKIGMIAASICAVGTGVGSWFAIAGAKEDDLDINHKAALIGGSIGGSVGLVGQVAGTIYALAQYKALKTAVSSSYYTTTMDLGKDGADLTVRSSALNNVGCDFSVINGMTANPLGTNASKISIAPKGETITLDNKAKAKFILDNGQKITLDLKDGNKKLEMGSSGIFLTSQGVAAIKMTSNALIMQKENAANIRLTNNGAQIQGDSAGQNVINVTSSGVRMQFANGQINSKGMLKANANGMIMLG